MWLKRPSNQSPHLIRENFRTICLSHLKGISYREVVNSRNSKDQSISQNVRALISKTTSKQVKKSSPTAAVFTDAAVLVNSNALNAQVPVVTINGRSSECSTQALTETRKETSAKVFPVTTSEPRSTDASHSHFWVCSTSSNEWRISTS